ncbi:trehalose-phosphatase [Bordetella petrii]|uniref:trehalose-phosphatase n=1 Tax=Bordetella petrii TaxID=94624 RepID=UPI003730D41B
MQRVTGSPPASGAVPVEGSQAPPVPQPGRVALFLDLDGTLAEIRPDPGLVAIPRATLDILARLDQALDGALAILSGRPGVDLDRLLQPLALPYAAGHGAEWRGRDGRVMRTPSPAGLPAVQAALQAQVEQWPGVWIEPKGHGMAVHFRAAPEYGGRVEAAVREAAGRHPLDLDVQPGKMVFELRPRGVDKGQALRRFMQDAPYAGRTPVAVGDDLTDEAAFIAARQAGGFGIKIGAGPSAAPWRLDDPRALARWLERLGSPAGADAPGTTKELP